MSLHRRAARRDQVEPELLRVLRQLGIRHWTLSATGLPDVLLHLPGCPRSRDLAGWVAQFGIWLPVEVKTGTGTLTPAQAETWAQTNFPVVRSVVDVLALIGAL